MLLVGIAIAVALTSATGARNILGWPLAAGALIMLAAWLLERGSLRPDPMGLILGLMVVLGVGLSLHMPEWLEDVVVVCCAIAAAWSARWWQRFGGRTNSS